MFPLTFSTLSPPIKSSISTSPTSIKTSIVSKSLPLSLYKVLREPAMMHDFFLPTMTVLGFIVGTCLPFNNKYNFNFKLYFQIKYG